MDKSKKVQTVPDGYTTVTPWIISRDTARLIQFIKDAFNGYDDFQVETKGKIGHAEIRIGDLVVMMFDAKDDWPDTPGFLRLYVENGDATYEQALKAGAESITRMTELPFGDRVGRIRDPLGNIWWINERIVNLTQEEAEERSQQKEYIKAMEYVQSSLIFPAEIV